MSWNGFLTRETGGLIDRIGLTARHVTWAIETLEQHSADAARFHVTARWERLITDPTSLSLQLSCQGM